MSEEQLYGQRRRSRAGRGFSWVLALIVALVGLSFFIPTNYYVTRPGSAIELGPMIDVEGGKKDETGAFMLTTVRMGEANLAWYVYANLSPDAELMPKELVVSKGEDNEDFVRREQAVMDNSQKIAEAVAFRLAGYEVKVEKEGVWVMGTLDGLPAKKVLKIGDIITAVDGVRTAEAKDLLQALASKKAGDQVEITYTRDGQEAKTVVTLVPLPESKSVGIGVRPDNKQQIFIPKKVTIASQGIGGPSAGLMMALEILDQLDTAKDLTKGYKIAGTGTISLDGTVGRIGGINHKVIAADKAGAEIFFAPQDTPDATSNYQEALATAKRIGTSMQIVPVKNVVDAIAYLDGRKPKSS
ncbi:SepM family pheromone-processing serine protease [Brevibacillus agri]|uniref:SepM family pheromone-processing serine protease n=1 Tax=Brevibacillus agri TaxID=51101 RepID=UPI001EE5FB24|nr:SepM family pheromone-processing serine protease [Brevibacillus agri]MCG5253051.1 PDZ domain-containing protein [Brevibacillus agri]MDN4092357.1 SepM family pheromone-processing serine protease [Brevibacillus agri]